MTDMRHRAVGFYGLRDGQVAVFAGHRSADTTLLVDARAALRQQYAPLGWVTPWALSACPPSDQVYYDQVAQIVVPSWSRGRVGAAGGRGVCGLARCGAGRLARRRRRVRARDRAGALVLRRGGVRGVRAVDGVPIVNSIATAVATAAAPATANTAGNGRMATGLSRPDRHGKENSRSGGGG